VGGAFQWRVSGGFPRHGLGEELGLRLGSLGDRPDENSFNAGSRPRERREARDERRETRGERRETRGERRETRDERRETRGERREARGERFEAPGW